MLKKSLDSLKKTESDLEIFGEDISGFINIGAAETHTTKLIDDYILNLRKDYPKSQFSIFSGSTIEVTEKIQKGLIDFGILVAPIDYLNMIILNFQSKIVLVS